MSEAVVERGGAASGDVTDATVQMLKLDHLGEFIAVNIYAAQVRVCRATAPQLVEMLQTFLSHERSHLQIFAAELAARNAPRCRAFHVLGAAGFLLGFLTALLGKAGIAACTAAVETVVLTHLEKQRGIFRAVGDAAALAAVDTILAEEQAHKDAGADLGANALLYRVVFALVAPATAAVIALGMRL